MGLEGPVIRILLASLFPLAISDTPLFSFTRSTKSHVWVCYAILYALATAWAGLVTKIVPEPYLDEVFHIPQAQAYCDARYDVWDPKLTTPPGLYVFATIFVKVYRAFQCSPMDLRLFNATTIIMILSYASDCRALITWSWKQTPATAIATWRKQKKPTSPEMLHTAFNVALFPPLFFFSGLFYTDVLSTCVVLRVYRLYLERQGAYEHSAKGLLWLYPTGIVALTMRQTNIFWIAVFLGALEVVRTIKSDATKPNGKVDIPRTWQETAVSKFNQYSRGEIHDLILRDAGLLDFVLCAISIVVAAAFRPLLLLTRLWPYILLLASFAGFLVWNGGVVLGDKSNHVATVHLMQMFYIWPFIAFFSAPLLIPVGLRFLQDLVKLLQTPLFPRLLWKYFFIALFTGIALSATQFIIKFNTIIHPFTLADNRHYMFYIFRYTILRHPLIRYMLAPIYLVCAWLVYLTLCTPSAPAARFKDNKKKETAKKPAPKETNPEGPTTSFVIVLLVSTALSLIGAPLVEPRYFIIPWVIWRLNVPKGGRRILWAETAWFLLINVVTGYVFLYRGFEWPQEAGKVQRFMW